MKNQNMVNLFIIIIFFYNLGNLSKEDPFELASMQ